MHAANAARRAHIDDVACEVLRRRDDAALRDAVGALRACGSAAAAAAVCAQLWALLDGREQAPPALVMRDQTYGRSDGDDAAPDAEAVVTPPERVRAALARTPRARPTAIAARPNALAGARLCADGPLAGQFEAYARVALAPGALVPFAGRVVHRGRRGYEYLLPDGAGWRAGLHLALDPSPRCAATFVNDAFGPERGERAAGHARQNVAFELIRDGSGFPHVFLRATRAIAAGAALWGDYGDGYWEGELAAVERVRLPREVLGEGVADAIDAVTAGIACRPLDVEGGDGPFRSSRGGNGNRPRGQVRPRPVEQLDAKTGAVIRRFRSVTKAQKQASVGLAGVLSGRQSLAGGFKWRYAAPCDDDDLKWRQRISRRWSVGSGDDDDDDDDDDYYDDDDDEDDEDDDDSIGVDFRGPGCPTLSPAEKMQKMRQWFEQNDGTPRFDDSTAGFNMGKFWQTCCSRGYHKELFTAALAESSKMKEAHEARLNKKNMNTLRRGLRHRQASSDESDSDDDVLLSALRRPKGDEGEGKLPPPPAEKMEQDWSSR